MLAQVSIANCVPPRIPCHENMTICPNHLAVVNSRFEQTRAKALPEPCIRKISKSSGGW